LALPGLASISWAVYAYLPVGCFVIWAVFLNLAQERIRELVGSKADQE
jgi:hypothetical protein